MMATFSKAIQIVFKKMLLSQSNFTQAILLTINHIKICQENHY